MKFRFLALPIAFAVAGLAQTPAPKAAAPAGGAAPSRVAIIAFQGAVLATQEGQRAQTAMKAKFDPRKTQLEKRQADLRAMQQKLQGGGSTLAADVRAKLETDVASGTRSLNNDAEDLNSDVQQEEGKVMQGMAAKMGDIIKSYAAKNGYSIILDVSSQQTPVLWAQPAVNITDDIVKLYDQQHPAQGGTGPAGAPAPAPKPPAAKKQ